MRSPQDEFRTDLDKQFIDGAWREGQHDKRLTDVNPYDGTTVAEFAMADVADTRPRRPRRHSGRRSTPLSAAHRVRTGCPLRRGPRRRDHRSDSALVVLADADIDLAVNAAVFSRF